ncbi:hypothetical protein ABT112_02205 [Streptomyces sp. NPDC002055]|uniref:hypothetical protein n=1 Tax=Streptomyces sp. NPDC002055 TaxID=3154534 RepID=UPI00331E431E
MTRPITEHTGQLFVHYSQFLVQEEAGSVTEDLPLGDNGLVEAGEGRLTVHTGIHTGDIEVTLRAYGTEPEAELAGFEEVVEVSVTSPSGNLTVGELMTDPGAFPSLAPQGPGSYRLRFHARGRDTAPDEAPEHVVEWYLIQSWPAPPAPPQALALNDACGAELREASSGQEITRTVPVAENSGLAAIRARQARLEQEGD